MYISVYAVISLMFYSSLSFIAKVLEGVATLAISNSPHLLSTISISKPGNSSSVLFWRACRGSPLQWWFVPFPPRQLCHCVLNLKLHSVSKRKICIWKKELGRASGNKTFSFWTHSPRSTFYHVFKQRSDSIVVSPQEYFLIGSIQ